MDIKSKSDAGTAISDTKSKKGLNMEESCSIDYHRYLWPQIFWRTTLAFGLTVGCVVGLPVLWHKSLGMSQLSLLLAARPVNLAILQEAHERKLLRQVGSVYQFRSAEFQAALRMSGSPAPE
jgi:hypothetical protein